MTPGGPAMFLICSHMHATHYSFAALHAHPKLLYTVGLHLQLFSGRAALGQLQAHEGLGKNEGLNNVPVPARLRPGAEGSQQGDVLSVLVQCPAQGGTMPML